MSKNSVKRRADEDAVKEMVSPLELPDLSEEQQKLVDAQVKCRFPHLSTAARG
jgi:hypothetical protein